MNRIQLIDITGISRLARGLLLACPMLAACVVPKSLSEQPDPPLHRPVFVAEQVQPPFGRLGPFDDSFEIELKVVAEDPNLDEKLEVRLFTRVPGGSMRTLDYTGNSARLDFPTLADPRFPTRRTGRVQPLKYCRLFGPADLYVIVGDSDWDALKPDLNKGLTDENHWELNCN